MRTSTTKITKDTKGAAEVFQSHFVIFVGFVVKKERLTTLDVAKRPARR